MKLYAAALGAALTVAASPLQAQTFPVKPVTIVIGYAAGGPSDTIARLIAPAMSQKLGQQVLIENTAGAGGTLGIKRVAKSPADGYTILISHISHASSASLYKTLDYNPVEDFAPIGLVTDGAMALIANAGYAPKSMAELIKHVQANGDKVTFAHAGIGSGSHLCALILQSALKAKLTQVAYRGTGPAMNDIVGGQVDLSCDQVTNVMGQFDGGKVRIYGVTSKDRLGGKLRDTPTTAEGGLPDLKITLWHGLYAPKGTPPDVMKALQEALHAALDDANFKQRMQDLVTTAATKEQAQPAVLKARLEAEIKLWRELISAAGVSAE